MSQNHLGGYIATLVGPVGWLFSPVFGFSLSSYGPAILVAASSLAGIVLKYFLDERLRRKARSEWEAFAGKPTEEWHTGERKIAEEIRRKRYENLQAEPGGDPGKKHGAGGS
jgi:hypothetical protein